MNEVKNSDVRAIEDENKCRNRGKKEEVGWREREEIEEERKRRRIDRGKGV